MKLRVASEVNQISDNNNNNNFIDNGGQKAYLSHNTKQS